MCANKLRLLLAIYLVLISNLSFAIPAAEREALITFYNSTGGNQWTSNNGWLGAVGTECSWFGITCIEDDVTVIELENNGLTGSIPSELGQLSQLLALELDFNQLTGSIPSELAQLSQLQDLDIDNNQLTGSIPHELGQLSQLKWLYLDNNQLTGKIPSELGQLSQLQELKLYSNQLTGAIPSELAQLSQLQDLDIDNNQLIGNIPGELGQLSQLQWLYLDNNLLTGNIPTELKNLILLVELDLSENCLSTTDPELITFLNGKNSGWENQRDDCSVIQLDIPVPTGPMQATGSFAEPSDTAEQAIPILVSDEPQYHLLDNTGGEDWFEFYTVQGTNYSIEIPSDTTGSSINPVLTLFDEQGNQIEIVDNNPTGQGEILNWTATATGLFRVRVSNQAAKARNAQINALDYAYQIKVFLTDAPQQGLIKGFVLENCQQTGLAKAAVSAWTGTSLSDSTFTHKTGEFGIPLNPGNYDVISQANNYQDGSKNTNVEQVKTSQIQIDQQPLTDCSQTTVTVDPVIQQQQAVSSYNNQTGLLVIKDVWAGGNAYYAELQNIGNFNFVLADAIQLPGTAHTQPADYSFGTQLLTLPTVSAQGKTYKVQMKSDADFVFTVTLVGEPD